MADQIHIREARPDDLPQILAVLKAALGETQLLRRTPDLFAWKHDLNPFGKSVVLVAEIGGSMAGVRAMMRWDLFTPAGNVVRCLRPVDTATDPRFARQGVFRELTMAALEVANDSRIDLVFNTPNPQSAPGYFSMGWREVGWIGGLVRPLFGRALEPSHAALSLESAIPSAIEFRTVDGPSREPLGLRTRRTVPYQQWRFGGHPYARYGWVADGQGGGAVVRSAVRRQRSETVIADFLGGSSPASLVRARRGNRTRYVAGWFARRTPERRSCIRAGLLPVPGLKALRLVALPLADLDINVFDLGSWDFATSDMELL